MKIFVDSANLTDIEEALKRGFAEGITTNPSLLAKEPKGSFKEHVDRIIALINQYRPGIHLSIEVFSRDPQEMLRQALEFKNYFEYPDLSIKVQVGWDELKVVNTLSQNGISVNCTACMDVTQALMAAEAGAEYVSIFWGRLRDGALPDSKAFKDDFESKQILDTTDFDPATVVRSTRLLLERNHSPAKIIVGSIRSVLDIKNAGLAGAHIVTVPPKFFPDMLRHYKTDQVVNQFITDFESWLS